MRRRAPGLTLLLLILSSPLPARACLWDYDTLRDEQRGLPEIASVLAGKFERHSEFFYRDRVARMESLLQRDPNNLPAYDNLAVAHEKLGDPDTAIVVMLRKESVAPNQYTTHANLGTFYFHKGDLAAGIPYIEKALALNPDAHFGREHYQLQLARFLLDRQQSPTTAPATEPAGVYEPKDFLGQGFIRRLDGNWDAHVGSSGLSTFGGSPARLADAGLKPDVFNGIVGMIRFGTGKSPDLYYALGNALVLRGDLALACRAYRKAIALHHPDADGITALIEQLRNFQKDRSSTADETIAAEQSAAADWLRKYQQFEDALVRDGKDVNDESAYAPFYAQHGSPRTRPWPDPLSPFRGDRTSAIATALIPLVVLAAVAKVIRDRRRKRRPAMAATAGASPTAP
jgi:tetratricopeptide (TPR) repeat protein